MPLRPELVVKVGDEVEMVEGPYMGWQGVVIDFSEEEPGWILVDFNGNHIEVPACNAARTV